MNSHEKAYVERLRARYPAGTRIELTYTSDPYAGLKPGDQGAVQFIDDVGTFHMLWDSGSTMGLIPGFDTFKTI